MKDFSRLFDHLFMHERVNKDITESYVHSVHILCTGGKVPLLLKAWISILFKLLDFQSIYKTAFWMFPSSPDLLLWKCTLVSHFVLSESVEEYFLQHFSKSKQQFSSISKAPITTATINIKSSLQSSYLIRSIEEFISKLGSLKITPFSYKS